MRSAAQDAARGARGGLGPGTRRGTGGRCRLRGPAKASAAGSAALQRFVCWDSPSSLFPFQAKGAPRKLEAGPFLTKEERLLAQDEYEEDSSDEEVGPAAKLFVVVVVFSIGM